MCWVLEIPDPPSFAEHLADPLEFIEVSLVCVDTQVVKDRRVQVGGSDWLIGDMSTVAGC